MRKARATFQGPDPRAFGSSAAESGAGTELDLPRGQSTNTFRRRIANGPWAETLKLPTERDGGTDSNASCTCPGDASEVPVISTVVNEFH